MTYSIEHLPRLNRWIVRWYPGTDCKGRIQWTISRTYEKALECKEYLEAKEAA